MIGNGTLVVCFTHFGSAARKLRIPLEISENLLVFFQNNCKMLYCFGWSFIWPEESAQVRVNEVVIVEEINFKLRSAL